MAFRELGFGPKSRYLYKRCSGQNDSTVTSGLTFRRGQGFAGYATAGNARLSASAMDAT